MIKIYVHYHDKYNQIYVIMVIMHDMILHSDIVMNDDLNYILEGLTEKFSNSNREVKLFKHLG